MIVLKNSLNYLKQFFSFLSKKIKNFYFESNLYDKKISKFYQTSLEYKPSSSLLHCLIKYNKKKNNIEDYSLNSIWTDKNIKLKDHKNLHSFFWLSSLDLKSSKKITQTVILNWIENNQKYKDKTWNIDVLSKRVISWLSNSNLTYEDNNKEYKTKFNNMVQKQINHLVNQILKSTLIDNKMIGCAAIILAGLCYKEEKKYLNFGFNLLKKIINSSFDSEGFPKSRSFRHLNFYYKYFILIREWLKESQNDIPEYLDEIIFHLGNAYSLVSKKSNTTLLFNGNHETQSKEFNEYLISHGYKFKNNSNETGGYLFLENKKTSLVMDIGNSPEKKFSKDYQCGALSFEIIFNDKKIICNSGYYQNYNKKLNELSKSTANHSTLIINDHSSCKLRKIKANSYETEIEEGLKILKKNIIYEKNYWNITSSHDGYKKRYGIIHERQIEFFPEENKFVGLDKILTKKLKKALNFEIRFHLMPNIRLMKTQDKNSIFIDLEDQGWKFTCNNYKLNTETGLYFGKKNNYDQNKNLFIEGIINEPNQTIKWELNKIS